MKPLSMIAVVLCLFVSIESMSFEFLRPFVVSTPSQIEYNCFLSKDERLAISLQKKKAWMITSSASESLLGFELDLSDIRSGLCTHTFTFKMNFVLDDSSTKDQPVGYMPASLQGCGATENNIKLSVIDLDQKEITLTCAVDSSTRK